MSRIFLFTNDSLGKLGAALADSVARDPGRMRMTSERVEGGVRMRISWDVDARPIAHVAREIAKDVHVLDLEPPAVEP